ncbi:MAG: adenylate/guanylate cyclase domain-containing protein [Nitratireductor sp.]|nr:adenylate/guanylate cyclase domain-containing protein [Nitratireductor sp.]MCB1457768.1 adenylate/guanylate cyclase domain-containing protein [Nitratireductor sp.]
MTNNAPEKGSVLGPSARLFTLLASLLYPRKSAPGVFLSRLFGIALLVGLLALRIFDPVFVQTVRNQSFDLYQRIHPREFSKFPVAIADIDESSLKKYGQWPWPRTRVAELVTKLTQAGAVVIGFDIIFAEADRLSPERIAEDNPQLPASIRAELAALPSNEEAFARAIAASRVVVGETSVRSQRQAGTDPRPIPQVPSAILGLDPEPFLPHFPDIVRNLDLLEKNAAGHGVFTVDPDNDGIFRRVPLVMKIRDQLRLGLSAEMLRVATGGQAFAIRTNAAGISGIVVGGVLVPTDSNGKVWPRFSQSSPQRYVSAGSILDGTATPGAVKGHLVLVGTSAVGLEDYRATPVAASMPGVEIHAQIIENIMGKSFLTRPNYAPGMELIFFALSGLAIIWIIPNVGAIWAFISSAAFLAIWCGGSFWAFFERHMLIDATFPSAAMLTMFVAMATANYIREERQKRQIRGAFGQYLSPALVDQLTDDPELLTLGGETRPLSVLFTDVRKFTTISESYKTNPQGLTRLMNRFLTVMSNAILERSGTIDKYMGDAIMAFWNAPLPDEDHALDACKSALSMLDAVRELNIQRKQELEGSTAETWHEINIGIGINTGDCVVGNMGSEMRFDYTALGDTVNLASRLEGQSKPYGISIILGSGTANVVRDRLPVLEIDLIRVKGKTEPEHIYALMGDETVAASDDWLALRAMNASMLSSYRTQDWSSAEEALAQIEGLAEKLGLSLADYLFIYDTRIQEFRSNPPGKTWDGIYDATEK